MMSSNGCDSWSFPCHASMDVLKNSLCSIHFTNWFSAYFFISRWKPMQYDKPLISRMFFRLTGYWNQMQHSWNQLSKPSCFTKPLYLFVVEFYEILIVGFRFWQFGFNWVLLCCTTSLPSSKPTFTTKSNLIYLI